MEFIMNFKIPAISLSLSQTPIPKHIFQHALNIEWIKENLCYGIFEFIFFV